jgi:hypothetical protein
MCGRLFEVVQFVCSDHGQLHQPRGGRRARLWSHPRERVRRPRLQCPAGDDPAWPERDAVRLAPDEALPRGRTLARFHELVDEQEQFLAFAVNRTRSQPRWKNVEIGPDDSNGRTVRLFTAYEQVEAMAADEWTDPFGSDPFSEGEGHIEGLRSISSRLGETLTAKRKEWFSDPEAL